MTDTDDIRRRAIDAHGRTWTLLEKADRTDAETGEMIGAAHASLKAWEAAGGPIETQRGNWLVARAYVDAGLAEPALIFARRTIELTREHQAALAGNLPRAKEHYAGAKKLGEAIKDEGDRAEFFRQFALEPWSGLATAWSDRRDSRGGRPPPCRC